MCVLAFAWQAHPRWRLVLAGNRDEFHARPAQPLGRWARAEHVLGGIDLQSGGTWLGVSEQGRLAVVTNLRGFGAPRPDAPSRGALLADFLVGEGAYAAPGLPALAAFNPFNLITVEAGAASFRTNRPQPAHHALPPGIHGVSNGPLDAPWFKTERLRAHVATWLAAETGDAARLLDALRDDHAPTNGRPLPGPSDVPQEPPVSPIFIRDPVYGTRCGTAVLIDADGRGIIAERRYDTEGEPVGERAFDFRWPG
jgi:uncharacterized protein with NRDE domain